MLGGLLAGLFWVEGENLGIGGGYRRKLIEVDLPLDVINRESAREKSIRHGHPSTLHLWWARRPLAACRAVIFASLVDDPSSCAGEFPTVEAQDAERERLHDIISRLVVWDNSSDEGMLAEARREVARSVARSRGDAGMLDAIAEGRDDPAEVLRYLGDKALPIYDPFCGGGSIPLEAQRLGLRAVGSDLNPVAVLITKALIELPPRFAGRPPVSQSQDSRDSRVGRMDGSAQWRGASGLAEDIRHYGRWMREEAHRRIGHLYPPVIDENGKPLTVIAWLWARTVPCPNPACGIAMPLMRTFQLSKKPNNKHWTRPVVKDGRVSFEVQGREEGVPKEGTVNRHGATCVACGTTSPLSYVREQSKAGKMGERMTAIVAEGDRRRVFLSPTDEHVRIAQSAEPEWRPAGRLPEKALGFGVQTYGFTHWHNLFSERQIAALATFSESIYKVRSLMLEHGASADYADAVCTYLGLAVGRMSNSCSSFARWQNAGDFVAGVFAMQTISILWDFAESNPFCTATQNWMAQIEWVAKVVEHLPPDVNDSEAYQANASTTTHVGTGPVVVTDPPYYANIGYADLSDFFYVWLRPLLRQIHPELFTGMATPKDEEMVATPFRFKTPRQRFENLLDQTLKLIRSHCSPEFPSSIFYAYKQQEDEHAGRASTGWETMLTALVSAGFQVISTWPMRTERPGRSRQIGSNALASSVVLVCRPRGDDAPVATRREFLDTLGKEMPDALDKLTAGHIAPTDLAQAAIGPGMEVYSRYKRVSTLSGEPVTVRDALSAINRAIAEYDRRETGELDGASRFCVDWLRQHGYADGEYGSAETLAKARNVSVEGLRDNEGVLEADEGKVRLLGLDAYDGERAWPRGEMTAWEGCMRMMWQMQVGDDRGGVKGAAEAGRMMRDSGGSVDSVERLARILYNHYDGRGDSRNAVAFNALVTGWGDIDKAMQSPEQGRL